MSSRSSKTVQLGLLLWKNGVLQWKKKLLSVVEISLPLAFAFLLYAIRINTHPQQMKPPTHWEAFTVDDLPTTADGFDDQDGSRVLWYAPNNSVVNKLMTRVATKLNTEVRGFLTEDDLLFWQKTAEQSKLLGAVVFDLPTSATQLPVTVSYAIRLSSDRDYARWETERSVPEETWPKPRESPLPAAAKYGRLPGYYFEGFLSVQRAVDLAIILAFDPTAAVTDVSLQLKRQPFPAYRPDPFTRIIQQFLPGFIMLSFIVLAPVICKEITLEKEQKLKAFLEMTGVCGWQQWLAWFIKYFICTLVTVTFFLVSLFAGPGDAAPSLSDASVVFVFLLLYSVATISFCFAIAACFSAASSASKAGAILFVANYAPALFLTGVYSRMQTWMKVATCLFHNVAMAYGCQMIGLYDGRGVGLKWSNIRSPITPSDTFTMLHVLLMLVLDSIFYGLIAWCVDAVRPSSYGKRQHLALPFQKFCCCGKTRQTDSDVLKTEEETLVHGSSLVESFEPNSPDQKTSILIRDLKKVFKKDGQKVVAVDGMSLDILEGQITAVLGHSGAGKTTTMFMITGFLSATSGRVYIDGHCVQTSSDKVCSNMGICPQENILYDELTVAEQLYLFGRLKGIAKAEIGRQVTDMMKTLGLESQCQTMTKQLSSGMKRKLCLGIALIGNSKVLILDEPTLGMDPENRYKMWDVLRNQREGRTIILSTRLMNEADYLGDRIVVMAHGQAQCCGTSHFLKSKYGVGYHVGIVKESRCSVDELTSLITSYVPQARLQKEAGSQLSYVLPKHSSHKFEALFTRLEAEKEELGISSFGASCTTMEEVFSEAGARVDKDLPEKPGHITKSKKVGGATGNDAEQDGAPSSRRTVTDTGGKQEKNTGCVRWWQHYQATFLKRLLHTWRHLSVGLLQVIVPTLFAVWACITQNSIPSLGDSPPLTLSLSPFMRPVVPYGTNATLRDDPSVRLANVYADLIRQDATQVIHVNNDDAYADEPDMEQYLIDVGERDLMDYISNYVVAASFGHGLGSTAASVVAYFNNEAYHTPAISLNYASNGILQFFTDADHFIEVTNHPLPRAADERAHDEIGLARVVGMVVAYILCFGMSFLLASFVVFLIRERSSGSRHVQLASGVHVTAYWAATFSWDLVNFMIPSLLVVGVFIVFDVEPYFKGECAWWTFLTFMMFGCAGLPMVYGLSFLFKIPSTGYNWTSVLLILTVTLALITIPLIKLTASESCGDLLELLFHVVLPNACFLAALNNIYQNYGARDSCWRTVARGMTLEDVCRLSSSKNMTNPCCRGICGSLCDPLDKHYAAWQQPGIGRQLSFMLLQCIVYFVLLFLIESDLLRRCKQTVTSWLERGQNAAPRHETVPLTREAFEDGDVQAERERISSTPLRELQRSDLLILQGLRKSYGKRWAVVGLSAGVPKGECFGLLGLSGAGKTTTLKMLTGGETPSAGDAWLQGLSVRSQTKLVQQRMGYCPQLDALIDQLTVRETLLMYARLRGVQERSLQGVVEQSMRELVLEEHGNNVTANLSGGNKRKLSTAIALIGDPAIVFLDEPTTGADPVARRLIWDVLAGVRANGTTIVLASHSMEECEVLCTRIAMMVNGQFRCLGSTQALKSKFSQGYTVTVQLTPGPDLDVRTLALQNWFRQKFPGCGVRDLRQGYLHYHVPSIMQTWAQVFARMEHACQQHSIEDYSVRQTTLEQVFMYFARAQRLGEAGSPSCTGTRQDWCKSCLGCETQTQGPNHSEAKQTTVV